MVAMPPILLPFVKLGNHVIMPNHLHGIISIDKPIDIDSEIDMNSASPQKQQQKNKFGPQSKNLASIIRGYKASIKK